MRQKSVHPESPSERIVKNIRRATRKRHSSEEKIRIVLDGLRGESSIAELCRREGIAESLYYAWSKEFLEAGKRRLAGDTARAGKLNPDYAHAQGQIVAQAFRSVKSFAIRVSHRLAKFIVYRRNQIFH
jgi:transposase